MPRPALLRVGLVRIRRFISTGLRGDPKNASFATREFEGGLPTMCAESCVGRIRYVGVLLYDSERIKEAASTEDYRGLSRSAVVYVCRPQ